MRKLKTFRFAHWLVLLIGLGITLLAWESARSDASKRLQEEFDFRVNQTVSRIEKRVQDIKLILRGTVGLFSASSMVTRQEFRAYIESIGLEKNYPGIRSVAVSRWIASKDRNSFERFAREDGTPDYRIWPEGEREQYAPVLYLEPATGQNRVVLGYDVYSESLRRQAMEQARDSGRSAITDRIVLFATDERETQGDFLVFAPQYQNGAARETQEQRQANLLGWVQLAFRMDDMVRGIMGDTMGPFIGSISLSIFAGESSSEEALVYRSEAGNNKTHARPDAQFQASKAIPFANKTFTVVAHSTPAFEARINDTKSIAILVFGVVASALIALLVWQLSRGSQRAIRLARRMNHTLLTREKRYRQMFEDNASIAYILEPETGKIIDANEVAAKFWGYSVTELRTMNIADINLSPADELQTSLQQQIADGNPGQFIFRHRLKNGEIRDVEIYRSILTNQDSTFIYCIVHDITSRKRAEKALLESQQKLRVTIETAMDAVVQMDAQGTVIDWNSRAERTFGWSRQEAIGQPLIDLIIPTQYHIAYMEGVKQFVEGEEGMVRHSHFEVTAVNKEGREFPVEVAITTIVSSNGGVEYCAFMHDITERKKAENALRRARIELENRVFERTAELVRANRRLNAEIAERTQTQEALQQSQEMLRQLVAHQDRIREGERKRIAREIHDELGQHLLVLRIDVSMLGRAEAEHPKLGERVEAILQHIDTTMKSVRAIINNLRPSVLDLGLYAALEWQAEEFQRRSGIACELVADDEDLELDDSVATVLFRILQEALTNVLRHARASRVRIELQRKPHHLIMTIADNGIGMKQAGTSEQSSFGLVGIRERLHILGGDLSVDSSGNGTVLTVSLPLAD